MNPIEIEQVVCASVLTEPNGRLGPNLSTALAYAPQYWHSPEAARIAEAIGKAIKRGWRTTPRNVALLLEPEYKKWVDHPIFKDGLPLGLAEFEAGSLLPHFRNRRIAALIAICYQNVLENPDNARIYAQHLVDKLGAWL